MNRELAEVRRYWPRARMSGQLLADGAVVLTVYAVGRCGRVRIGVYADGTATVDGRVSPTIPEAMRAAGFGRRKPGFHSMLNLQRSEWHRYWLDTLGHNWRKLLWESGFPKTYATRQRPRKGARLGRRKRSPDGLGKNWRAAARGR